MRNLMKHKAIRLAIAVAALFLSASGCTRMHSPGMENESATAASSAAPEPGRFSPGLEATYVFGLWRHLDELPEKGMILDQGQPGPPVPILNHSGDREALVFDSGVSRGVGLLLRGFVRFPSSGKWSLQAISNDGLRVLLNGERIIEDPDVHGDRPSEIATASIPKPDVYPIEVLYFQRKGASALRLLWKPPGERVSGDSGGGLPSPCPITRESTPGDFRHPPGLIFIRAALSLLQKGRFISLGSNHIPGTGVKEGGLRMRFANKPIFCLTAALVLLVSAFGCASMEKSVAENRAATGTVNARPASVALEAVSPGLSATYVYGYWQHLNDMPGTDEILRTGTTGPPITLLDHSSMFWGNIFSSGKSRGVGALIQGFIRFPSAGRWELQAVSNDGVRVFLSDTLIISDPTIHPERPSNIAEASIPEPGLYPITIRYFQNKGASALRLRWKGPGETTFSIVPAGAYFHLNG